MIPALALADGRRVTESRVALLVGDEPRFTCSNALIASTVLVRQPERGAGIAPITAPGVYELEVTDSLARSERVLVVAFPREAMQVPSLRWQASGRTGPRDDAEVLMSLSAIVRHASAAALARVLEAAELGPPHWGTHPQSLDCRDGGRPVYSYGPFGGS